MIILVASRRRLLWLVILVCSRGWLLLIVLVSLVLRRAVLLIALVVRRIWFLVGKGSISRIELVSRITVIHLHAAIDRPDEA